MSDHIYYRAGYKYQTNVEQMKVQLKKAGWRAIHWNMWQSPSGAYFLGPYGAWKIMSGNFEVCK